MSSVNFNNSSDPYGISSNVNSGSTASGSTTPDTSGSTSQSNTNLPSSKSRGLNVLSSNPYVAPSNTVVLHAPVSSSSIPNFGAKIGSPFSLDLTTYFDTFKDNHKTPPPFKLTYSAIGLPSSMSLDPATGMITGTIPDSGPVNITVMASNKFGVVKQVFSISPEPKDVQVTNVPLLNVSLTVGDSLSINGASLFSGGTNQFPMSYQATNLPEGLSINPTTGQLSGIVMESGSFSVTLTATSGGNSISRVFTINANTSIIANGTIPPIFINDYTGASHSLPLGAYFTASTSLEFAEQGALPEGLSFVIDQETGTINVIVSSPDLLGTYSFNVVATDEYGETATQAISVTLLPPDAPLPAGTIEPQSMNATTSSEISLNLGAYFSTPLPGQIFTYSAAGLPAGLSFNGLTGKISVLDPTIAPGNYQFEIKVTDNYGQMVTQNVSLQINPAINGQGGPQLSLTVLSSAVSYSPDTGATGSGSTSFPISSFITVAPELSSLYDDGFNYSIASVVPTTAAFQVSNSGDIVTLNYTGVPLGDNSYTVVLNVTDPISNEMVQVSCALNIHVENPQLALALGIPATSVSIDATSGITVPAGDLSQYFITAGQPLTFSAMNLPAGVSFDGSNFIISGAAVPGSYAIDISATDEFGTVTTAVGAVALTVNQVQLGIPPLFGPNSATALSQTLEALNDPFFLGSLNLVDMPPHIDRSIFGPTEGLQFSFSGLPNASLNVADNGTVEIIINDNIQPYQNNVSITATAADGGKTTVTFLYDPITNQFTDYSVELNNVELNPPQALMAEAPVLAQTVGGSIALPQPVSAYFNDEAGLSLSYSARELPAGVTFDSATGTFSISNSAMVGTYTIYLQATDPYGLIALQPVTLTVNPIPVPPLFGPNSAFALSEGLATLQNFDFNHIMNLVNMPPHTDISIFGPTAGLQFSFSGFLANTRIAVGTNGTVQLVMNDPQTPQNNVSITATAANGGTTTVTFIYDPMTDNFTGYSVALNGVPLSPPQPTATQPPVLTQSVGDQVALPQPVSAYFSDAAGLPLTYGATNLPAGVTFDVGTGTFAISSSAIVGTYTVNLQATDPYGLTAIQPVTLTVNPIAGPALGPNSTIGLSNSIRSLNAVLFLSVSLNLVSMPPHSDVSIFGPTAGLQFSFSGFSDSTHLNVATNGTIQLIVGDVSSIQNNVSITATAANGGTTTVTFIYDPVRSDFTSYTVT